MKIAGSYTLAAPPDRVWPMLFDPAVLLDLIPGCIQIESDGPDAYCGVITLRLPAVSGTYRTAIQVLEQREPEFCRMDGEAAGAAGSVKGQAAFTLRAVNGGTLVEYEADAIISGPLAGMNPRFAGGVAQQLIKQGLARLDARLAAAMAAEAAVAPAPVEPQEKGLWARFVAWVRGLFGRVAVG
jgi:carbon monoxide dehydrogenase subunit G